MTDHFVAADVVTDRFDRLQGILQRTALTKHEERVGRIEEVLVEGPSKRDPGMTSGRTRQNKLIHFGASMPAGSRANVLVTTAAPHFLRGQLVEWLAGPRHRTHIPVTSF